MSELSNQRPIAEPVVDWSFFSMARYLMTAQPADERVLDGSEWDGFLDLLRTAGTLATELSPAGLVDRVSASRGLLQMLHFGLERTLGAADPSRPVLSRPWPVHLFDYGAGNPDAVYRTVVLRDDLTYRVSGDLGNAPFLSFEFFDGTRQTGSLLRSDLRADADGRFEVTFGPEERPGNWLAVVPGTSYLLTREFFDDWSHAQPSLLEIECLDAPASSWPVMTADRVSKELEAVGQWLIETVRVFGNAHVRGVADFANAFEPTALRADSDLPTIYHGFWDLAAHECLLIETPEPEGDYWGFQLSNALWNTLDFANRQTSLNRTQAHVDRDGQLRLVLAHEDPGVPNWLDTLGHEQGAVHVRLSPARRAAPLRSHRDLAETVNDWMSGWGTETQDGSGPGQHPVPQARVVKLAGLRAELPPATPTVHPAERARILAERLRQVTRMQRS
ncbi:DUF1214 domain-containing protein [Nocardioides immobilis]|uniref:DUF1214 domain-containing protein n=1 Tax=Nocardioides immobilis TaxID=2049295 RepID=A0A417XU46_9ACTN|nr:DUF1214 domain-containing protein [Nocardioides immobilis]RHW23988.1 DUF1214 domain-containing protein [Nocardioides immobilis]